jgi:type II restriction/modification system DNA methylase subunit YeeA
VHRVYDTKDDVPEGMLGSKYILFKSDMVQSLISYAVGCMFGRYSIDKDGLILANQDSTLEQFNEIVPLSQQTFHPDTDGIVPTSEGGYFKDYAVTQFKDFLVAVYGKDTLQENVTFIEDALGKSVEKYFANDFYKDHQKTYKNRPIYWEFSSKGGAFKCLVYLHRFNASVMHRILNNYLNEMKVKVDAEIADLMREGMTGGQTIKLTKVKNELEAYERDVLYPFTTKGLELDLDDGVLVNYLRFTPAVTPIPALEKQRAKVRTWTWPKYPLED